jgi:hypothetical protein
MWPHERLEAHFTSHRLLLDTNPTPPRTTQHKHQLVTTPTPPTKDSTHTTKWLTRMSSFLCTLPFPYYPSTKNTPSIPRLIETLGQCFGQETSSLHILGDLLPNYLGIHNEVLPNEVFNLGFMPLLLVENCHCVQWWRNYSPPILHIIT